MAEPLGNDIFESQWLLDQPVCHCELVQSIYDIGRDGGIIEWGIATDVLAP
jgi:hypothetical protein